RHLHLWDVATGRECLQFQAGQQTIRALAFSPDGRTLASTHDSNRAYLWETASGRQRCEIELSPTATALAFTPDGRLLATGDALRNLRVRDLTAGRELHRSLPHLHHILSLAVAPDGRTLVSGSRDGTGLVWDLAVLAPQKSSPAKEPTV